MTRERRALVALVLIACAIGALASFGATVWQQTGIARHLDHLEAVLTHRKPDMITTEWTSGGSKRTYTTTARADETPEQHAKRHANELAAIQRVLPPG